jgi:hypothetical protein
MIHADGGRIRTFAADATCKGLRKRSGKTNNKGETSMTDLILQAVPLIEMAAPKFEAAGLQLRHALDAFVAARIRNALPGLQLRKARRDLNRYRRLMRPDHKSPVEAVRSRSVRVPFPLGSDHHEEHLT